MLQFRLNGEIVEIAEVAPHESALVLLRETLKRCGTKEGCASGDCGACTVALRDPGRGPGARFESVNACILPAWQLEGLDVVTVEGLAKGEALHPVQRAMVDHHASQCGFCTPGFVMSLFTLYHDPEPLDDHRLAVTLGGNLCRCTGYRPIRAAALAMRETAGVVPDWIDQVQPFTSDASNDARAFHRPATLAELDALLKRHPDARLVAGGTDLMLESTIRLADFPQVIDLTRIDALKTIEEHDDGWWVGAGVTYTRLAPLLERHYPAFARLLDRLGSQQVRNRGTLAGNVANASPIGDTPPVLLALDARLRISGGNGVREMALSDFFLDYRRTALAPGEYIQAIWLPRLSDGEQLKVWKLSKRRDDDISAVLMAIRLRLDDGYLRGVRVAFGGMAATPKRALETEAELEDRPLDEAAVAAARAAIAREFTPLSDARASSDYRLTAAGNLLERLRLQLAEPHVATEIH